MHFDQTILNKKIQAIKALLDDQHFQPAKLVSLIKEKEEKAKLRVEKAASAAMLRAQQMAFETKGRQEKKDALAKAKAEKLARKIAIAKIIADKRKNAESYWGSDNINTKPVKKAGVKKADNNLNGRNSTVAGSPSVAQRQTRDEKVFKTKPLNLEDKIKVEVKKGLWVYVDRNADIEAVKAKYNREPLKNDKQEHLPPTYQF